MQINNSVAFFLLIVAFVAGYWLVSFLYSKFQMPRFRDEDKSSDGQKENYRQEEQRRQENSAYMDKQDKLAYYSELFNLNGDTSAENIKCNYRELLRKYHPDKVSHLGHEFQVIAEQKTRELNEGYEYLKARYNF